MDERRKFKRVPTDAIVIYKIQNFPEGEQPELQKVSAPISVDISEGGLKIITRQVLLKDTFLRINLSFPEQKTPMEITGKVVWEREERMRYSMGIKFVDFDDEEYKKIIIDYINNKKI